MIQGPLKQIMQLLEQGTHPLELVRERSELIDWIDVGEAMLITQHLEEWEEFVEKAPEPVQVFLTYLTHSFEEKEAFDLTTLLDQVRSTPFSCQVLEARIRLEQAVLDASKGRLEEALERAEWAEVRLGVLGQGGRHHAMAVIVRINLLIEADQSVRALHLCSEFTRDAEHDPWTIGLTRLIAGRIMYALGRHVEAVRVAWIALCLLRGVGDFEGAKEAGTMLLMYSEGSGENDVMLKERTGLDLSWKYGDEVNPPASSGKILAMGKPGLHEQDRSVIDEFLSEFK